jgi:hypothetical protein
MIAFGSAVTRDDLYRRHALPSIQRVAEADSAVLARHDRESIQVAYNEILDEAAALDDLEALVLMHQDLELTDSSLCSRTRRLLADSRVGAIGLFGARDPGLAAWWEGSSLYGQSTTPFSSARHSIGSHEVEVVDGALLILAPWVVESVRFDEALAESFHGYDVDVCLQIRARGGRVVCTDLPYVHHMSRPWRDPRELGHAALAIGRKWHSELRPREWTGAVT